MRKKEGRESGERGEINLSFKNNCGFTTLIGQFCHISATNIERRERGEDERDFSLLLIYSII